MSDPAETPPLRRPARRLPRRTGFLLPDAFSNTPASLGGSVPGGDAAQPLPAGLGLTQGRLSAQGKKGEAGKPVAAEDETELNTRLRPNRRQRCSRPRGACKTLTVRKRQQLFAPARWGLRGRFSSGLKHSDLHQSIELNRGRLEARLAALPQGSEGRRQRGARSGDLGSGKPQTPLRIHLGTRRWNRTRPRRSRRLGVHFADAVLSPSADSKAFRTLRTARIPQLGLRDHLQPRGANPLKTGRESSYVCRSARMDVRDRDTPGTSPARVPFFTLTHLQSTGLTAARRLRDKMKVKNSRKPHWLKGHPPGSPAGQKFNHSKLCYLNILFQLNKLALKPGFPLVGSQLERQFSRRI